MKNHSMLTHFFFIFFLSFFLLHHITVATSTPPYIAVDDITLDCGFFGNSKATDERDWIGDIGSKYGPMEQNNESQRQASSVESIPYSRARLSYSQFTCVSGHTWPEIRSVVLLLSCILRFYQVSRLFYCQSGFVHLT